MFVLHKSLKNSTWRILTFIEVAVKKRRQFCHEISLVPRFCISLENIYSHLDINGSQAKLFDISRKISMSSILSDSETYPTLKLTLVFDSFISSKPISKRINSDNNRMRYTSPKSLFFAQTKMVENTYYIILLLKLYANVNSLQFVST